MSSASTRIRWSATIAGPPCPRAGGAAARSPADDCVPGAVSAAWAAGWPPPSSQERGEAGAARGLLTRLGLSIFFTMNVMAFTMALWTTDVYGAGDPSSRLLPG